MTELKYYPVQEGLFVCLMESCGSADNCVGVYQSPARLRKKHKKEGKREKFNPALLERAQRRADMLNKLNEGRNKPA